MRGKTGQSSNIRVSHGRSQDPLRCLLTFPLVFLRVLTTMRANINAQVLEHSTNALRRRRMMMLAPFRLYFTTGVAGAPGEVVQGRGAVHVGLLQPGAPPRRRGGAGVRAGRAAVRVFTAGDVFGGSSSQFPADCSEEPEPAYLPRRGGRHGGDAAAVRHGEGGVDAAL